MGKLTAQTETMQDKARAFDQSSQNLVDTLSKVTGDISELQAAWTGSGADAFSNVMNQWNKDVQQLINTLEEVANNVHVAGVNFQDLDNDIRRHFGG